MTEDEELAHLKAPSLDPKQRQIDYWGHRAEKAEDEVGRLRAALKSIADYAPGKDSAALLLRGVARNAIEVEVDHGHKP